jgi:hypothetical protein
MTTDAPRDARCSIPDDGPDPDDPTSDLVAQVQHYSRTVTEAELCRRRAQPITPAQSSHRIVTASCHDQGP